VPPDRQHITQGSSHKAEGLQQTSLQAFRLVNSG
jgi:hypothetical protein